MLIPTFNDFVATRWVQLHPGDTRVDAQWAVYNQTVHEHVQMMLADPAMQGNDGIVTDILAEDLLETFFGPEWVAKRFGLADKRGQEDFRWILPAHRRRELARRVYEFQSFSWFQHFIDHTRTNEIPSALYEGDVLSALMHLPATVTRNKESGIKGQDFDILLEFLGEQPRVPVEVKNKDDDAEFKDTAVRKVLKKAATQLPKGEVGWVFLRIPTTWVGSRLEDEYPEILHDTVRQTSRIGAVFTAIDKFHLNSDRSKLSVNRIWHYFPSTDAPDVLRETSFNLYRLLEQGMDHFAPRAPF
ncbi:hypothetical protein PZB75_30855 (plasmid) [Streptomyces sp. AM 4-1-1]|uniref:hypothetical protein n=1 Tax=unclassified Streptomyces TaxID=2593676 RepID=UPI0023BA3357|nr:hypothetical protein [Streptomyces sp. AM 4-1-1]WEH37805.1 hypothetical protein PZB75_30855 [Streptomyces sp. AM 4-1-1]